MSAGGKPGSRGGGGGRGRRRPGREGALWLYGRHAAIEALRNPRRDILRICATINAAREIGDVAAGRGMKTEIMKSAAIAALLPPTAVHQGLAVQVLPLPETELADMKTDMPAIVLDQVTDPHNVGAILRSAAAFGAGALVMTRRNSPPAAGVLAKAACGALEHVAIIRVANLARALDELREMGFEVIGLDGEADEPIEKAAFGTPPALVLGAEGSGLRRLTREKCARLCRIETCGPLSSLNVSNAAAIALHAVSCRSSGYKSASSTIG